MGVATWHERRNYVRSLIASYSLSSSLVWSIVTETNVSYMSGSKDVSKKTKKTSCC